MIAFLIPAYLVLFLLLGSYCFGIIPRTLIKRTDRKIFSANSRRASSFWKDTAEEIILAFSDQQLITGFGILVAGFAQAFSKGLETYHWNFVINLSWLSSTVHLASLSFLRNRLNRHTPIFVLRLCLIVATFGLLLVAIVPTTKTAWTSGDFPAMPVHCMWSFTFNHTFEPTFQSDRTSEWNNTNVDSILTYLTIITLFIWKLAQFFETSHGWLRLWARAKPECILESAAARSLQAKPSRTSKLAYMLIIHTYIPFVVYMDMMDSFMATNLALTFTLIWGTLQLLHPLLRDGKNYDGLLDELQIGFGQMLPLLLSLQAITMMIGVLSGK